MSYIFSYHFDNIIHLLKCFRLFLFLKESHQELLFSRSPCCLVISNIRSQPIPCVYISQILSLSWKNIFVCSFHHCSLFSVIIVSAWDFKQHSEEHIFYLAISFNLLCIPAKSMLCGCLIFAYFLSRLSSFHCIYFYCFLLNVKYSAPMPSVIGCLSFIRARISASNHFVFFMFLPWLYRHRHMSVLLGGVTFCIPDLCKWFLFFLNCSFKCFFANFIEVVFVTLHFRHCFRVLYFLNFTLKFVTDLEVIVSIFSECTEYVQVLSKYQ